jgi:four helix bundle protein
MKNSQNLSHQKAYAFSIRIVRLSQYLHETYHEYVLSRQILRSGTAVAALLSESKFAQSLADFISKLSIAIKEANETKYWIHLLHDTEYIDASMHQSLQKDIQEIIKLLAAIIKKLKGNKK